MSIKDQIKAAATKKEKVEIFQKAVAVATFASPKTVRKWERLVG